MEQNWYVYLLTNITNTVLYVGATRNLQKRVWEHKSKVIEGFTKKYHLHKLVYYEIFDTPDEAIVREKQIKGWTRKKKDKLVDGFNPEWKDLYEDFISW